MDELKRLYEKLQKQEGVPNHRIRENAKETAKEYKWAIIEMFKLQSAEREGLTRSNIRLMTENLKLKRTKVQQIHQLGEDIEGVRKYELGEKKTGINQFSNQEIDNKLIITRRVRK